MYHLSHLQLNQGVSSRHAIGPDGLVTIGTVTYPANALPGLRWTFMSDNPALDAAIRFDIIAQVMILRVISLLAGGALVRRRDWRHLSNKTYERLCRLEAASMLGDTIFAKLDQFYDMIGLGHEEIEQAGIDAALSLFDGANFSLELREIALVCRNWHGVPLHVRKLVATRLWQIYAEHVYAQNVIKPYALVLVEYDHFMRGAQPDIHWPEGKPAYDPDEEFYFDEEMDAMAAVFRDDGEMAQDAPPQRHADAGHLRVTMSYSV